MKKLLGITLILLPIVVVIIFRGDVLIFLTSFGFGFFSAWTGCKLLNK